MHEKSGAKPLCELSDGVIAKTAYVQELLRLAQSPRWPAQGKKDAPPPSADCKITSPDSGLSGTWFLTSVEVPAVGICRKIPSHDEYFFEFCSDESVVAHINGDTFESKYTLANGYVTFSNIKLAAFKLIIAGEETRVQNYLGTNMVFRMLKS